LDSESLHEFSVGLALARNHQDRIHASLSQMIAAMS